MLFYNMTPRISVEELKIDMPCSLESYFANDAESCHHAATTEFGSHLPQLSDSLAFYLGRRPEPHVQLDKKCLSILDFYVMIIGTYEPSSGFTKTDFASTASQNLDTTPPRRLRP